MGKKTVKTEVKIDYNPDTHYMHPKFKKPYLRKKNVQMIVQTKEERAASRKAARRRAYLKKKHRNMKADLQLLNAKFGLVESKGRWDLDQLIGHTTNRSNGLYYAIDG